MKIIGVKVGCLFNTGNYENQRFELEAKLQEGDTPEAVADALKHMIHLMADKEDLYHERNKLRDEIRQLADLREEAREAWNKSREFLVAQGLRPDAPEFPVPAMKALQAASIQTDVVEANEFE